MTVKEETSYKDELARILGTYNEEVVSPFLFKAVDVGRDLANIPLRASGFDELEDPTEEDIEERRKLTRQVTESVSGALGLADAEIYDEEGELLEAETFPGQAGQIAVEMSPYVAGFAGAAKGLGALGMKEGFKRTTLATIATEQALSDPYQNIFNIIEQEFPEASNNVVVDFMAADKDDSEAEARLKMVIQDIGFGALIETGIISSKAVGRFLNESGKKLFDLDIAEETEIALRYFKEIRNDISLSDASKEARRLGMGIKEAPQLTPSERVAAVASDATPEIPTKKEALTETPEGIKQIERQSSRGTTFEKYVYSPASRVYGRFLTSRGYFTPKSYNAFRDSQYAQRQTITQAEDIANRLTVNMRRIVEASEQGAFPKADIDKLKGIPERVQEALTSDASIVYEMPMDERFEFFATKYNLPENIARDVAEARKLMDDLSYKIIGSKGFKQEAKNSIRSNVGSYMRRSYRLYEDPLYEPDNVVKENAVQYLVDDILEQTPDIDIDAAFDQARTRVNEVLGLKEDNKVIDYLTQVRKVAKFKKKTDIPEPIRALMGEIREAPEALIISTAKASRVYEVNNFYRQFNELGKSGGYLTSKESQRNTAQIKGTNSILDGKYTTPEMLKALDRKQEEFTFWTEGLGWGSTMIKEYASLKGLSQSSATILNHGAHIRNALGSIQMAIANGANPFSTKSLGVIANKLSKGGDKAKDDFYQEMQRLGVINTSVKVNESRALLDIGFEREPTRVLKALRSLKYNPAIKGLEGVDSSVAKGVEIANNVYQASDDFFKISNYLNELAALKKAFPDVSEDLLKADAARKVKDTFPNYDKVPPGIKGIRDMPFGNFVSFPAEVTRTSINILKESANELSSGNNVLRARGLARLTGFMAATTGFTLASKQSADAMGWTEEERQAHTILAEGSFYKKSNKIWGRDNDGEMYFIDTKFLDTYEYIKRPAMILADRLATAEVSGEELNDVLVDSVQEMTYELLEPYVSDSMITDQLLTSIGRYRRGIIDIDEIFTETASTFIPGTIKSGLKLVEAINKTPPRIGDNFRKTETELLANVSGMRRNPYDPDLNLEFALRDYNAIGRSVGQKIFDNETSEEEYIAEFEGLQDKLYEGQQELFRIANAHATLYGYQDTKDILIDNGMGSESATYLLMGLYKARSPKQNIRTEAVNAFKVIDPEMVVSRTTGLVAALEEVVEKRNGSSLYKPDFQSSIDRGLRYSSFEKETGRRVETSNAYLKMLEEQEERQNKAKGGEVLDVPNASKEPDQRIDKMTGLPYDQQAGTAFVDEEDPLRRLGFTGGGEVDPLQRLGFVPGGTVIAKGLRELFTPTKTVGREGSKRVVQDPDKPVVMTQTEELEETLDPRMGRAMDSETASSVMPAPGKFFDPEKSSYKEGLTKKAEDAGIEVDLEFGKYLKMGRELEDVSNKTFQNLYVTSRPSEKLSTFGQNNKSVARANEYDGTDLTIAQMKANYKKNTGVKSPPRVQTNLLQPEKFEIITDEGSKRLDNPIVSVEAPKSKGGHFYALDYQLVGPVRMNVLTAKNPKGKVKSPNLRPETVGEVKLGNIIGTIKTSGKGKTHPLYDYIEVDGTPSLPEGVTKREKFVRGGYV
jgi:hypothetical protein